MDKLKQLIVRRRLATMVFGAIAISATLVSVALNLYYTSGSFQLDLSRPEYKDSRKDIQAAGKDDKKFDVQGRVTKESLDEFLKLYKVQEKRVNEVKAFENNVLSDENLNIDTDGNLAS